MKARATLLDHPIHQMLVVVPLGLFFIAVVFDFINALRPTPELSIASYWNIVAGCVGAVVAAVFGVIDWTKIPSGTRAKKYGTAHGLASVVLLAVFVLALGLRAENVSYAATTTVLVLEFGGFALAGLVGFLGGELVGRFGIGVQEGAHPNAARPVSARMPPNAAVSMRDDDPHAPTISADPLAQGR